MVTKNLIALMLTWHPLGLIENIIHTPIDRVVNKKFCTDNKLLNVWVHLATCLSVDSLIHGTGHEVAESLIDGGWCGDSVVSDYMSDSTTDLSSDISTSEPMDSITEVTELTEVTESVVDTSTAQSSSADSPMKKILEQKARSMSKMMEMMGDGDMSPSQLAQIHQAADAQWLIDHTWHHHVAWDVHVGHHHGDWHTHEAHADHESHAGHDHEHGWHGVLPILWW
jgi:hypothetical protein